MASISLDGQKDRAVVGRRCSLASKALILIILSFLPNGCYEHQYTFDNGRWEAGRGIGFVEGIHMSFVTHDGFMEWGQIRWTTKDAFWLDSGRKINFKKYESGWVTLWVDDGPYYFFRHQDRR